MNEMSKKNFTETWASGKQSKKHEVDIYLGKPVDILSLKENVLVDFKASISAVKSSRLALFNPKNTESVKFCPICKNPTSKSLFKLEIYGGKYHQCPSCLHNFIINRPRKEIINEFYCKSSCYASTYTSKGSNDIRMKQVAIPKAKWMLNLFKKTYGRNPRLVLDVGAGAGHFVSACKILGIPTEGIEVSKPCREFCEKSFGFELHNIDFMKCRGLFTNVEIITFWGVIEHVPEPLNFLRMAYELIDKRKGLIITEVPRWECLSTIIQSTFSNSIIRHLDPVGHIHCFTDNSLIKAFEVSGFTPSAAWYFGMDAYELITQLSYFLKDKSMLNKLKNHIHLLQGGVDNFRLSDEMIFAGKPIYRKRENDKKTKARL